MKNMKVLVGVSVLGAMVLSGGAAFAQDPDEEGGSRRRPKVKDRDAEVNDHNAMVGRFGAGYLGASQVAVGIDTDSGGVLNTMSVPTIGVRYWLDPMMGLDLGLGLGFESGSKSMKSGDTTTDTKVPKYFAFLVHAGVPLSFASGKHHSFQVIPEINFGIGSGGYEDEPEVGPKTKYSYSGMRLDIGARAGAEIHFGFIGVPELSLQGSVGLLLRHESIKTKRERDQNETTWKASGTRFGTTIYDSPWNIFTANVAALYYF